MRVLGFLRCQTWTFYASKSIKMATVWKIPNLFRRPQFCYVEIEIVVLKKLRMRHAYTYLGRRLCSIIFVTWILKKRYIATEKLILRITAENTANRFFPKERWERKYIWILKRFQKMRYVGGRYEFSAI